jgi:hypothetical protein
MKTKHEVSIQFSGYPLRIVEISQPVTKPELIIVKASTDLQLPSQKSPITNDPQNWDIDWFNSYE